MRGLSFTLRVVSVLLSQCSFSHMWYLLMFESAYRHMNGNRMRNRTSETAHVKLHMLNLFQDFLS